MKRIFRGVLLLLCSFNSIMAEVSLSGMIKKYGGITGIAGVNVSLSKAGLSTVTDTNGMFVIKGSPVVQDYQKPDVVPFFFKGKKIVFSNSFDSRPASMEIFSIAGERIFCRVLEQLNTGDQQLRIPELSSGLYIICLNVGAKNYTFSLTYAGDDLFFKKHSKGIDKQQLMSFAGIFTNDDTLIIAKNGYRTKKLPITSYKQNDITIFLDSNLSEPGGKKGLTIYFIRHAETVANASGQQGGEGPLEDHDTLTELGQRQVEELKNFLIEESIIPDLIVVSPSLRTQKTIEPFLIATRLKADIWVELNECCGEEPSGLPLPTERPVPRWKMKVEKLSENFIFPTESDTYYWWPQSYEEGLFMVMNAHDRLLEKYGQSGKTVILVGHAVNGGVLLGLLRGYDMLTNMPERPVYLMNTGIVKLTQDTITGAFTLKQNVNKPSTK